MSQVFKPTRTNKVPWSDELTLITETITKDADGYETVTESTTDIFCTFADGINRTEFYEAMKAGITLSASVEVWQDDYGKQKLCEHDGVRYKIVRSFETGRGTVELSLSEVIR